MRLTLALVLVIAASMAVIAVRASRPPVEQDLHVNPVATGIGGLTEAGRLFTRIVNEESELGQRLESVPTDADRRTILLAHKENLVLAKSLLDIVRQSPADSMAVPALSMIATRFPDTIEGRESADLLLKDHISDESLANILLDLEGSESDLAIKLLHSIAQASPHPRVRAYAEFSLGCLLKTRAERDGWRRPSASRDRKIEATRLFEDIVAHHGDLSDHSRGRLADLARAQLDELQTLGAGSIAPEIDGEDTEGRPMRLGEHRGKIVVLSFWGHWCSLCRSMYSHERSLVERMRGRPFVMLGINSDNQISTPQALVANKTVTWRSWKDGGEVYGGSIAAKWHVRSLPDFFIIDAMGVIRHHVGPHADDHERLFSLDEHGELQHRWKSRIEEVREVAEALVDEIEHPVGTNARMSERLRW